MIHLLTLLCSMCIQFGAISLPVEIQPTIIDDSIIDAGFQYMLNAGGIYSYYGDVKISNGGVIITAVPGGSYIEVHYALAEHNYNTSTISTCTVSSYHLEDDGIYGSFSLSGFVGYVYYYYPDNPNSSFGGGGGFYNSFSYPVSVLGSTNILQYVSSEITDDNGNTILIPPNSVEVPTFPVIGSLDSSGHSSGGNPFESLNNSIFNWASVTGHSNGGASYPSPHSSSTHFSSTTPSPDNSDTKTDSLLFMLGNKLADITENTGAIGDALGGIMYNQVAGASALFNAISGFNDNFISAFTPPSKEEFSSVLHTSEIYTSYQNINTSIAAMTTTLNSVGQQSGYVWNITLPESWGGSLSFDFSNYLDANTLNFIRIIIGALLIISTIVFVAHQLPDIIGGGSGGENA